MSYLPELIPFQGQFRNQRLNLLFGGISKHFDLDLVMKEDLVENDGNEDGSLREI